MQEFEIGEISWDVYFKILKALDELSLKEIKLGKLGI